MKPREALRCRIQDLWQVQSSLSYAEIARILGTNRQLVQRWVQRGKASAALCVQDKPRTGRPPKLNAQHLAAMKAIALQPTHSTSKLNLQELQASHSTDVTASTLRRHMHAAGMAVKKVKEVPLRNASHKQNRLAFAARHQATDWDAVAFSDSKYFRMLPHMGPRARAYWAGKGETRTKPALQHSPQVHVYAAVTSRGVTPLYFVEGTTGHQPSSTQPKKRSKGVGSTEYIDMLKERMLPALRELFPGRRWHRKWQFMQDNVPAHTAKATKAFLAAEHVRVLAAWPPHSPDLNPIENMWAWAEMKLRAKGVPGSVGQFKEWLIEVWSSVPLELCEKLVHSMGGRLEACTRLEGAHVGR